jgi:hypothetical protein
MKWISIKDQLPEPNVSVLFFGHRIAPVRNEHSSKVISTGYCWKHVRSKEIFFELDCDDRDYDVTHWMPLPEYPEE